MAIVARGDEGLHRSRDRIVAEYPRDRVEEHTLAVAARSVDEEQGMLASVGCQCVARDLLKEPDQLGVVSGSLLQEFHPQFRLATLGRHGRRPRQHVSWVWRELLTGLQID